MTVWMRKAGLELPGSQFRGIGKGRRRLGGAPPQKPERLEADDLLFRRLGDLGLSYLESGSCRRSKSQPQGRELKHAGHGLQSHALLFLVEKQGLILGIEIDLDQ